MYKIHSHLTNEDYNVEDNSLRQWFDDHYGIMYGCGAGIEYAVEAICANDRRYMRDAVAYLSIDLYWSEDGAKEVIYPRD